VKSIFNPDTRLPQCDRLTLVAWGLVLGAQFFKKLFTAPEIGLRQLVMIFYKIPD
jgi:hypothetical protein